MTEGPELERSSCFRRLFVAVLVAAHAGAAAVHYALMPHGFAATHARFWTNEILVPVVGCAAALSLPFVVRGRVLPTLASQVAISGLWLGIVAGTFAFFARTSTNIAPVLLGVALFALGLLVSMRGPVRARWLRHAVLMGFALACGVGLARAHRAPPPSTRPGAGPPVADVPTGGTRGEPLGYGGAFTFHGAGLAVEVEPFVRLSSRSPDGGWTLFAPGTEHFGPPLRLVASHREAGVSLARYRDDGEHVLRLEDTPAGSRMQSWSTLPRRIDAHLSSFLQLVITGHEGQPRLRFVACEGAEVEVLPSDYPDGRPLRFAYRSDDDILRVVEATSGEKGPFRVLCEGPLRRGEALVFELEGLRFELEGWTDGGSTEASPTAGWGVPQATFSFSRSGDALASPLVVHVTLAGTGVGRGFDSVAHAAGTYYAGLTIEGRR